MPSLLIVQEAVKSPASLVSKLQEAFRPAPSAEPSNMPTPSASDAQLEAASPWHVTQPASATSGAGQPQSPLESKLEASFCSQPTPSPLSAQDAASGMLLPPMQASLPAAVQRQQAFPSVAQPGIASETHSQADDAYSMLFESDASSITSAAGLQKVSLCLILHLLP